MECHPKRAQTARATLEPRKETEGAGYRFGDTQHPPLSAVRLLASASD